MPADPARRSPRAAGRASHTGATTRSSTNGSWSRPGGPAGRGSVPRSPNRSTRGSPTIRTATCARATRGPTATSTRATTRRSSSPTTSPRSGRTPRSTEFDDGLLRAQGERGTCRVVCFSPRHDLTLGRMEPAAVRRVIDVWADQTDRARRRRIAGSRSSRTAATRWAPRTRIPTARSGPGPRSRTRPRARMLRSAAPRRDRAPAPARLRRPRIRRPAGRRGDR